MAPAAVVTIAVFLAVASVLTALVAISRRQYEGGPAATSSRHDSRPPGAGGLPAPVALVPVVAWCLEEAGRLKPRNSSEMAAISSLRAALALASDGEFSAEVHDALGQMEEIELLEDVHRSGVRGPAIDHLVVAPMGVVVIDSLARAGKVSFDADTVYLGRGRARRRDPMVDHVLREKAAVVALIDEVPVHSIIVFRDTLGLPPQIVDGSAVVQGVRLMTLTRLIEVLAQTGDLVERALVGAILRTGLRPNGDDRESGLRGDPVVNGWVASTNGITQDRNHRPMRWPRARFGPGGEAFRDGPK